MRSACKSVFGFHLALHPSFAMQGICQNIGRSGSENPFRFNLKRRDIKETRSKVEARAAALREALSGFNSMLAGLQSVRDEGFTARKSALEEQRGEPLARDDPVPGADPLSKLGAGHVR
jgi:hypothetical protein